jgi:hypothetical protein
MSRDKTQVTRTNHRKHRDPDTIAALAYHFWILRAPPEGSPEVDWLRAEKELKGAVFGNWIRAVKGTAVFWSQLAPQSRRSTSLNFLAFSAGPGSLF